MGLAEVLIAFAILLLVLVPVSYLLDNVLGQAATARNRVQALSIAEKWIEKLNACGPPTTTPPGPKWWCTPPTGTGGLPTVGKPLPVGTETPTGSPYTTSGTVRYHPVATFTWSARTITGSSQPDLCTSGVVPKVMTLTVTVSFPGGKVTDTTEIAYPPPGLPTDGFLGVQIAGSPQSVTTPTPPPTKLGVSWDKRVETVPVTVTTAATTSKVHHEYPGTDGCALFELPVGTYAVTVGPDTQTTQFVAPGSVTAVTVKSSTPLHVQLSKVTEAGPYLYDEGAYVDVASPDSTVADNAVTCPDVASFQCLADGQGTTGGTTAAVNVLSGTSWASQDLPASAHIEKIESSACTTAACVGVGFGAGGGAAVVDDPGNVKNWAVSSPPSTWDVSIIHQVACPTTTACLALAATRPPGTAKPGATKPVLLGATISAASTGAISLTWHLDGVPPTMALTAASQLTCAGSSACFVLGTTSAPSPGGPVVLVGKATGGSQQWSPEKLPVTMSSIVGIACAGTSTCVVDGTAGGPVVLSGAVAATPVTWQETKLPVLPATTRLSALTCVGTTVCVAIGNSKVGTTQAPSVVMGAPAAAGWTTTPVTLPTTPKMTTVSLLACGSSHCMVVGTSSTGTSVVASGPAATGAHSWTGASTVPSSLSLTHAHCAGTTTCVAVGASTATQVAVLLSGQLTDTGAKFTQAALPVTTTTASAVTRTAHAPPVRVVSARHHQPVHREARLLATTREPPPPAVETSCSYYYGCSSITSITPSSGPTAGGTSVVIKTSNITFMNVTVIVKFGKKFATTVHVTAANTEVTAVTPPHITAGTVSVRVITYVGYYFLQTATDQQGFTYVTKPPPSITGVSPNNGLAKGGTTVTVTGTHLTKATSVTLGGTPATIVPTKDTATAIVVTAPAHSAGKVAVAVTTAGGTATDPTAFTYLYTPPQIAAVTPPTGTTKGGTLVTITGKDLTGGPTVTFGGAAATISRATATKIVVTTPAHAPGKVAVAVTTHRGSYTGSTGNGDTFTDATAFTFVTPTPRITSVTPPTGTTAGGTVVSVTGHFLTTASAVTFGGTPGTAVKVVSATLLTVTTPAHGPGPVAVVVTTPGGTATKATAFRYVKPRPVAPTFLSGVSCYKASALTCVAAGATEHGAVLLVGTMGASGFTWVASTAVTPKHTTRTVPGLVEPDLPISVRNTALSSSFFTACTGTATAWCTGVGPLFPFSSGYTVGAGSCLPELATSVQVPSIPGTTSTAFRPPVTVPLGLLSVQVLLGGKPVSGATVSIKADDSTPVCNAATITVGTTQADGSLALAAILEKYTLTASFTTSTTVTTTAKTVTVAPAEMAATATGTPLPAPLKVTLP